MYKNYLNVSLNCFSLEVIFFKGSYAMCVKIHKNIFLPEKQKNDYLIYIKMYRKALEIFYLQIVQIQR